VHVYLTHLVSLWSAVCAVCQCCWIFWHSGPHNKLIKPQATPVNSKADCRDYHLLDIINCIVWVESCTP